MGETRLKLLNGRSGRSLRTISIRGDVNAALEEIRRLWPNLRANELRVVSPDQPLPPSAKPKVAPQPAEGKADAEEAKKAKEAAPAKKTNDVSLQSNPAGRGAVPVAAGVAAITSADSFAPTSPASYTPARASVVLRTAPAGAAAGQFTRGPAGPPRIWLAAQPQPTDGADAADKRRRLPSTPAPVKTSAGQPAPKAQAKEKTPGATGQQGAAAAETPDAVVSAESEDDAPPPIYIVPGEDSLTAVSDDPEALEQFERLLQTLFGTGGEIGRNISIYELEHSEAIEMAEKLEALYSTTSSRGGTSWRRGTIPVKIVPDERLNTIMVQGSRVDRETIAGLIRALDVDRGDADKPRLIPIRNVDAGEVAEVIRDVFRSQLSGSVTSRSRSSRSSVRRSSRNAPSVAVDEATNSLVVMAASPLLEEILELVETLDQNAGENPARQLRIIPLQKASSARVQEALDRILRSSSSRRTR
jgi:hypothetical protein